VPELAATYRSLIAWRRSPPPGPAVRRFVAATRNLFLSAHPAA